MPELPVGIRKRKRADKRVDLLHKDDAGNEYVAMTTAGEHVTDDDVKLLRVNDREHTTPREFAQHFIYASEANKKAQADAMEKDFLDCMETEILPAAYKHSPRQCATLGGGTKVIFGSYGHPRQRCYFGGCDYCY